MPIHDENPSLASPWLRGDRLGLWLLCAGLTASLVLYVVVAVVLGSVPTGWTSVVGFSLASGPLFRGFTGLPTLSLSPAGFSLALSSSLVLLWGIWLVAVLLVGRRLRPSTVKAARTVILAGGAVLLVVVVVLVPPTLSSDLYRQASYGHMFARWGLNPYAVRASDVAWNPLLPFATQTEITTIYGPAYTLISGFAALLTPPAPISAVVAWKTMSALAAFAMAWLAAPVARALDPEGTDTLFPTVLLLWNPLVILESAGAGHVEPIMMLAALAGLLLMLRGHARAGVAALTISTLTKWVTGLLLGVALLVAVDRAPRGAKGRVFFGCLVSAMVAVAVCYAPFVTGMATQGGIHDLALHGGTALGNPMRTWMPEWAAIGMFCLLAAILAWPVARGGWRRVVAVTAVLLLVFNLVVVPWLFPWYLLTPMVLVAVLPADRWSFLLRLLCFGLGGGLMLYYGKLIPLG